jgi:multicomponent Na+:H+ antiporter subunit D
VPLAALASLTIVWGSVRALQQDEIKKRLAFSTVSQVSYIVLGAALAGALRDDWRAGASGASGADEDHAVLLRRHLRRARRGEADRGAERLGARMPWTSVCFSLGALGMIGLPPMAGFVSKVYLGLGALEAGAPWVLGVLAARPCSTRPISCRCSTGCGSCPPPGTRRGTSARRCWSAPPW